MEKHSDKGRYLIALAILDNENSGHKVTLDAIDCLLAYDSSRTPKLEKILNRIYDESKS